MDITSAVAPFLLTFVGVALVVGWLMRLWNRDIHMRRRDGATRVRKYFRFLGVTHFEEVDFGSVDATSLDVKGGLQGSEPEPTTEMRPSRDANGDRSSNVPSRQALTSGTKDKQWGLPPGRPPQVREEGNPVSPADESAG